MNEKKLKKLLLNTADPRKMRFPKQNIEMPTVFSVSGGVRRHNNDKQLLVPGWSSNTFFTESFLLVEKN